MLHLAARPLPLLLLIVIIIVITDIFLVLVVVGIVAVEIGSVSAGSGGVDECEDVATRGRGGGTSCWGCGRPQFLREEEEVEL